MNKSDRKYITLNAVNGNNDAYCSVNFDFTGAKEKVSLSVNGESCETQSFYVVVKEGANFLAFYLGDLNKKTENKFEFKKEGCRLGSTIYTLKDVVAVQIVDNVYKQVLYSGIVDDNVGYKGTYTVVVDKPFIVRCDVDNVENKKVDVIEVEESTEPKDDFERVEEENTRLEEDLEEVEQEESIRSENGLEEVEQEESTRSENGLEEVEQEGNTRLEEDSEEVEQEANTRSENDSEEVEQEENTRLEDGLEEVEQEESTRLEDDLEYNTIDVTAEELTHESDIVNYGRDSKTNFEDLFDVEKCEMECTSQDVAGEKCDTCDYKIFYNEYECQVNEINDDFRVFNELYSRYLRNEFNKNYDTITNNEELDDNRVNGNIEFKNYQNFVEFERLKPDTETRDSDTRVINATFRASVDKDNKEKKGNSNDFYQQLIGDDRNKKNNRKNNKNTSFIDIFNYVKQEFDSIKEIMSLSDEEFVKRSEKEFGNEFEKEINLKPSGVNNSRTRNVGEITSLRSLIAERVEFKPFEMENHCVKWVQIKLNEVVGFFDNYWRLFWEPFVVDAYKEYRHLLLGVEEVDGEEIYFFAVPAVYNRENIDKAQELDFEYFEVVGDNFGEITDGASGYFIKELKKDEDFDNKNNKNENNINENDKNQNNINEKLNNNSEEQQNLNNLNENVGNKTETYTYGTKPNQNTQEKNVEIANGSQNINNKQETTTTSEDNKENDNYDNLDEIETEDMN